MARKRISILRGGPSSEHTVSMQTGKAVLDALAEDNHVSDIYIDKDGNWFAHGEIKDPASAVRTTDVVFNALHGEYGEDGEVQKILESLHIPYTGPRPSGARLSMDKAQTKRRYAECGIQTPRAKILQNIGDVEHMTVEVFRTMNLPLILKPIDRGSSVGIQVARSFQSLFEALTELFSEYDVILLEEYIEGKEGTVGVIDGFRGQEIYPLLPIEIRPVSGREFFDYHAKYDGSTEEICPGNFSEDEKRLMQTHAIEAHKALGLRHYSRTDFIIHPKRGIFALETNSLPGLTQESLMPKALDAAGSSYKEFLEHIIERAMRGVILVDPGRFELPASRLQSGRSSQLS